ncbi:MAG: hypothetical protein ABJN35_11295 [Erythrobacter sp.]
MIYRYISTLVGFFQGLELPVCNGYDAIICDVFGETLDLLS